MQLWMHIEATCITFCGGRNLKLAFIYIVYLHSCISVEVDSKLSSNSMGDNVFPKMKGVSAHFQCPSPNLKAFSYEEMARNARKFDLESSFNLNAWHLTLFDDEDEFENKLFG